MALLPRKVGSVTLMRALGNDGATETFIGILDQPAGKQVIVRKVLPVIARDEARYTSLRSRVADLMPIRHAGLLSVLDAFEEDGALYIVQEWVDAVTLADVITWCEENGEPLPHNIFLDLAAQVCNGLEALHSRPGVMSGARHVLHLLIRPQSIFMSRDGDVLLGDYGLVRSPTLAPHSTGLKLEAAYLSPEQTHQDQRLTPASDIFSLGAVLYELLMYKPMFLDKTPLRTIARVRRAEVTTQLLQVKEILPGLDRVLYRALSLNQRHRYQRAFVLREDLRGLMAGYSFSNIKGEARAFLEPMFTGRTRAIDEVLPPLPPAANTQENTQSLLLEESLSDVSLPGINPEVSGLIPKDSHTDPTGSFEPPGETQPFSRQAVQSPGPVGFGPSDLVEFGQEGPLSTASEELDLLDRELPTSDGLPPEPSSEVSFEAEVSFPQGVDDTEEGEEGSSGPMLAGALIAGLLGVMIVFCAGSSLLGVVGATTVVTRPSPGPIAEPAEVIALPPEAPVAEQAPPPTAAPPPPVLPKPQPIARAEPRSAPSPRKPVPQRAATPRPISVAMVAPTEPDPTLDDADWDVDMMLAEDLSPLTLADPPAIVDARPPDDIGAFATAAYGGQLSAAQRASLQSIPTSDPRYSRSRVLLYQDAKARGDSGARQSWMSEIMSVEANTYRPELLVEDAAVAMSQHNYQGALDRANRAEQYWSRLPSDLIFTRKAMIHEIQAQSSWALYTRSDPPQEAYLDRSINAWTRYRTHVLGGNRLDLIERADERLAHLENVRKRMH